MYCLLPEEVLCMYYVVWTMYYYELVVCTIMLLYCRGVLCIMY